MNTNVVPIPRQQAAENQPPLDEEQQRIVTNIVQWFDSGQPFIHRLVGEAGTGKTRLVSEIVRRATIAVFAPTNAACVVLKGKGCPQVSTLQGEIWTYDVKDELKALANWCRDRIQHPNQPLQPAEGWREPQLAHMAQALSLASAVDPGTVIRTALGSLGLDINDYLICTGGRESEQQLRGCLVDEASMVSDKDLCKLQEHYAQILLVGDPAQIPPVSLPSNPVKPCLFLPEVTGQYELTEIYRQGPEAEMILELARRFRNGHPPEFERFGTAPAAVTHGTVDANIELIGSTPIIVATNKARININKQVREKLDLGPRIQVGEPLIFDSTVKSKEGVVVIGRNTRAVVNKINPTTGCLTVLLMDGTNTPYEITCASMNMEGAGQNALYGGHYASAYLKLAYACTCHKLQGSEYKKVYITRGLLGRLNWLNREDPGAEAKWWYTAITRASEKVVLVDGIESVKFT